MEIQLNLRDNVIIAKSYFRTNYMKNEYIFIIMLSRQVQQSREKTREVNSYSLLLLYLGIEAD